MQLINKNFAAAVLLFSVAALHAQFEGYTSFKNDTALFRKLKKAGIKTATEISSKNGQVLQTKFYRFTPSGKVSDWYENSDGGRMHTHYAYNAEGLLISEQLFGLADSTQIVASENFDYNDKGLLLHKEKQILFDGKLSTELSINSIVLFCTPTKTITESEEFFRGNKTASFKTVDSIVGGTKYSLLYKYKENDIDEKGRVHGKKTLVRTYTVGTTEFEDNIEYEKYGDIESSKDITTRYFVRDAKQRLLEHGTIDYEAVYADFLQRHPDNFNPYQISGLFVEAVLKNEIKGLKRPDAKFTYNVKGQLIEKTWYGTIYKYKYDVKGNIVSVSIESESVDNGKIINTLTYNNFGLVSKMQSDVFTGAGAAIRKETTVTTLTYTN